MQFVCIATPFYRLLGGHYNGMFLGMGYIASLLNNNGHNAWILNADYINHQQTILPMEKIFGGFESYKNILDNEKHPIWQEVIENALKKNPDVIGFHMYTANIKACQIISKKIKKINPKIKIIVGGDHATLAFDSILKDSPEFDIAVHREGEFALLNYANGTPLHQISGIQYRDEIGNIKKGPPSEFIKNLDILPFPERKKYINETDFLDISHISTGRGCPFTCTYCASPLKWTRNNVRFRSPENVCLEIEELLKIWNQKNTYNNHDKTIYFVDDTFTLKKERIHSLLNLIIDREYHIKWKCDTRADCIDEELAQLMFDSGCIRAKIGVESGSEFILQKIKKGITKEQFKKTINILKQVNIPITIYLMTGFPEETDDDLKKTIDFAYELDVDTYSLSILAPYYGTELFNEAKYNNLLNLEHWEYFYHQSKKLLVNKQIKEETLNEFLALNKKAKGIYV